MRAGAFNKESELRSKASKLPIYRAGYNLAKLTTQLTKQFSRDLRATIGRRMQDDAILLVMDIYRANSSESKISEIESILGRLQAIELSFQLAFDLRQINSTAYWVKTRATMRALRYPAKR